MRRESIVSLFDGEKSNKKGVACYRRRQQINNDILERIRFSAMNDFFTDSNDGLKKPCW